MKKIIFFSLIVPLLAPLSQGEAAYYRWTDKEGTVHYSNAIPASYAYLGHVELSKQGIKQKKVLSNEETKLIATKLKIEKVKALAKEKAEIKRRVEMAEENRLLSVFSSEDEVIKSYNSKLRMAQLTIDLLTSRHKSQSERLERLENQYERMTDRKHRRTIQKQIDSVLDNLRIYQLAITENRIEKEKVTQSFKRTLEKFRKIFARLEKTS